MYKNKITFIINNLAGSINNVFYKKKLLIINCFVSLQKKIVIPITITINNNAQALAFIEYAKKLDFTIVEGFLDTQKDTIPNTTIEEDEYGIPIAHRDFLMKLSNQVKKNAAKRFYAKRAKMKTEK